jgi:hypothetical protein
MQVMGRQSASVMHARLVIEQVPAAHVSWLQSASTRQPQKPPTQGGAQRFPTQVAPLRQSPAVAHGSVGLPGQALPVEHDIPVSTTATSWQE